jgi:hypothetical protein
LPSFVSAQSTANDAQREAEQLEKQGMELLDIIAGGISNLRNSGNRVYLTSAVADLMWTKDEKRARQLFEIVQQEVVTSMAEIDPADQQYYNAFEMLQQRRRECLDRMVRRDPAMALAFLRATRPPPGSSNANQKANETNMELFLAGLIATQDPEQALRLGRQALRNGISYSLIQLISQLFSKNKELGQTLHKEVVERIKSEDLARSPEGANTAWNLLLSFQPPQASEETYRELIDFIANLVASPAPSRNTRNPQMYYGQLPTLIPLAEKYAPSRAPVLKQMLESVKRNLDPNNRMYQELNEIAQKGSVEDILALAGKYGPEYQTQIYQQAAWRAVNNGDINRARQIVSEFIADPGQRRQMLEQLDNQALWSYAGKSRIEEVKQLLPRVKSLEQRMQILVNLAGNVANNGDKQGALNLLSEARTMLDSSPMNMARLTAQLQLSQAYAPLNARESIALLQPMVAQINQLVAAAVVLDGFENRYLQEGEWMKAGYTQLGNLVNNVERNLGMLATRDAEGARSLSDQLERPEIRLMAQLEIAEALLNKGASNSQPMIRLQKLNVSERVIRR